MINWLRDFRVKRLNQRLDIAIFWQQTDKIDQLLKAGADPNGWGGRQRFLGKALQQRSVDIVERLLEAGADPRQPFYRVGQEFKMSDAARRLEYPELVEILEKA
jgi:hypothetical protein